MNPLALIVALAIGMPIPDETIRASIAKGIKPLEKAATNYPKNRSCFSCHHQALPMMALAAAKERGFAIDDKVLEQQAKFTLATFTPKLKDIGEGTGIGGASTTAAYALVGLQAVKQPRSETTDALVEFLLKKQTKDGIWTPTTNRPPSEGSTFTTAALALQALKHFARGADEEQTKRLKEVREKALARLQATDAKTNEDRVFLIWGLVVGGAGEVAITKAKDGLLKMQRPDGGWAQLDDMKSDAYATGSAMVAVRMAGVSPKDQAYRRGVRYLVRNQDSTGTWLLTTRSRPIQTYFDNGDPGGKSQFITIPATGWAVLALVECVERK